MVTYGYGKINWTFLNFFFIYCWYCCVRCYLWIDWINYTDDFMYVWGWLILIKKYVNVWRAQSSPSIGEGGEFWLSLSNRRFRFWLHGDVLGDDKSCLLLFWPVLFWLFNKFMLDALGSQGICPAFICAWPSWLLFALLLLVLELAAIEALCSFEPSTALGWSLRKSQMMIVSSCELLTIWNSSNWRRNTRPECSFFIIKILI